MTRRALAASTLLAVSLLAMSCEAGSEPTVTGGLQLSIATSGSDLDGNGYTVSLDGSHPIAVAVNETRTLTVPAGDHSVLIGDVAQNCDLDGPNPRDTTITAETVTALSIIVACRPTMTGHWALTIGVTPAGAGLCTLTDLTLDITEKHNVSQPVDSLLGTYTGGEGSCPYDFGSGVQNYPVSFPLDSTLYGFIDRQGTPDTLVYLDFGNPRRGTFVGYPGGDSIAVSLYVFVQDPSGHVVRTIAVARRH
jgi:hypothetical protein